MMVTKLPNDCLTVTGPNPVRVRTGLKTAEKDTWQTVRRDTLTGTISLSIDANYLETWQLAALAGHSFDLVERRCAKHLRMDAEPDPPRLAFWQFGRRVRQGFKIVSAKHANAYLEWAKGEETGEEYTGEYTISTLNEVPEEHIALSGEFDPAHPHGPHKLSFRAGVLQEDGVYHILARPVEGSLSFTLDVNFLTLPWLAALAGHSLNTMRQRSIFSTHTGSRGFRTPDETIIFYHLLGYDVRLVSIDDALVYLEKLERRKESHRKKGKPIGLPPSSYDLWLSH